MFRNDDNGAVHLVFCWGNPPPRSACRSDRRCSSRNRGTCPVRCRGESLASSSIPVKGRAGKLGYLGTPQESSILPSIVIPVITGICNRLCQNDTFICCPAPGTHWIRP